MTGEGVRSTDFSIEIEALKLLQSRSPSNNERDRKIRKCPGKRESARFIVRTAREESQTQPPSTKLRESFYNNRPRSPRCRHSHYLGPFRVFAQSYLRLVKLRS